MRSADSGQGIGPGTNRKRATPRKKPADGPAEGAAKTRRASRSPSRTTAPVQLEADMAASQPDVSLRERIALLAYSYWESRGCQGGSAEEDWFRAEQEILAGMAEVRQ